MFTYTDKTLKCVDCGTEFSFTASDQQFYADRQFSEPRRCPACRAAKKAARGETTGGYSNGGGGGGYGGGGYSDRPREMFSATCDSCGKEARVPFRPTGTQARLLQRLLPPLGASAQRTDTTRWPRPPGRSLFGGRRPPWRRPRIALAGDLERLEHPSARIGQCLRGLLHLDRVGVGMLAPRRAGQLPPAGRPGSASFAARVIWPVAWRRCCSRSSSRASLGVQLAVEDDAELLDAPRCAVDGSQVGRRAPREAAYECEARG